MVEKCERVKIIGDAMENSSAYLFPFIVEYSIIGRHVLYSMWRNIGKNPEYLMLGDDSTEDESTGWDKTIFFLLIRKYLTNQH